MNSLINRVKSTCTCTGRLESIHFISSLPYRHGRLETYGRLDIKRIDSSLRVR
jgi:hypothetical protein